MDRNRRKSRRTKPIDGAVLYRKRARVWCPRKKESLDPGSNCSPSIEGGLLQNQKDQVAFGWPQHHKGLSRTPPNSPGPTRIVCCPPQSRSSSSQDVTGVWKQLPGRTARMPLIPCKEEALQTDLPLSHRRNHPPGWRFNCRPTGSFRPPRNRRCSRD